MSKCPGHARRLPPQKTFKSSTSIVLVSIHAAPVSFLLRLLAFGATVIAAGRADNLAFAKTILSQSERSRLSSAVAFGLDRPRFQSQGESGVRRDVNEGVRPAHEGAAGGHRQPRRDVSDHPGVDPPAEVGAAR